jgi:hypothetical protein
MSHPIDLPPSAQILDFVAFRQRRAPQAFAALAPVKRQFLWSWPASGQTMRVEFPSTSSTPGAIRNRLR